MRKKNEWPDDLRETFAFCLFLTIFFIVIEVVTVTCLIFGRDGLGADIGLIIIGGVGAVVTILMGGSWDVFRNDYRKYKQKQKERTEMKEEKKNSVHTPEALAGYMNNCKKLKEVKLQLRQVEDELIALDEASEKFENSVLPILEEENAHNLERYNNMKLKALIGKEIALKYQINDLERELLDFEAAALMED